VLGIVLAVAGGAMVSYYKPPAGKPAAGAPAASAAPAPAPTATPGKA